MNSGVSVNLTEHLKSCLEQHPEIEIYVGCDSQNTRGITLYATTVVLRYPNRGAHVLYQKERLPIVRDMWSRLWREIECSLEVARFIQEELKIKVKQIDLDFNEDPEYPSHKVLKAARGYVSSMGFNPKAKPDLLMATWAANVLCQ